MKKTLTLLLIVIANSVFATQSSSLWTDVPTAQARLSGTQAINTTSARSVSLDLQGMKNILSTAPFEFSVAARTQPLYIDLPMPDGNFQRFSIVESPVCAPELAAKYPEARTWSGQGIDDVTATVRLDVTIWGFHAMILSPKGDIFIDPYNQQTTELYICYYRSAAIRSGNYKCEYDGNDEWNRKVEADLKAIRSANNGIARSAGETLRTYSLALACTGEYAAVFGGTVLGAHNAFVTSVNRVTGVYEKEMAIRLVLIPNNDTLIFTNAGTDPYTNNSGGAMLSENQMTITSRIGSANYDIGHVFSTGGGGIAGLGVVCISGSKARGVTGLPNPVGDAFDIDYVAHEMGHQYAGNHSFNSVTGACGGGNRNASTAYEPGSGITIMAYAGICGSDDLAPNSIANFHTVSFDEMQDFTTLSSGSICPTNTLTGNIAPVSTLTNHHYDIPVSTPFVLSGSGTDANGDTITYSWEQYDLGPSGTWNNPSGNAPIFMSYVPSQNGVRLFPKIANILANTNTKGELKPSYARLMNFRMTMRDNRNNGGGVTYDDTPVEVNVVNTTTPFAITYPNAVGVSWPANSSQTITWNVSGTTAAPISSPNVNIYLSTTGGTTYPFPILIASNVPNSGTYTFNVPNNQTTTARILVQSANNIFLDINDKNFAITAPIAIDESINSESIAISPNPAFDQVQFILSGDLRGAINVRLFDVSGRIVEETQYNKLQEGLVENMDISKLESGVYTVAFETERGTVTRRLVKN